MKLFITLILFSGLAFGHGGGLDSNGGHNNRKTGAYHCHRERCFSIHSQVNEAQEEAERDGVYFSTLYNRRDWKHWIDEDGDCQNTRAEILIRDSKTPVKFKANEMCVVVTGLWELPYSVGSVTNARQLDIDHIVPLKWAHGHGGDRWSLQKKEAFANDPENLLATYSSANRSKGAKGPDDWLPKINRCEYATRWQYLIDKYELAVVPVEGAALSGACLNGL
ncbi:MAG: hypothetical protein ACJAR0_002783 [Candidatus Azotimanducaceae bacterium]|jgi:hypothetical protein